MASTRDPYEVLGVAKSATTEEIRRAYKKLARKHHPDVNPGNAEAEARFKEMSAAYEVLSDEKKRAAYDEFGQDALKTGFDPEQARTYRRWQAGRESGGVPFSSEHFDFDLGDLFGGFAGGAGARRPAPRGRDVHAVAELDLEEAVRGTEVSVTVPTYRACTTCQGGGAEPNTPVTRCETCGGTGRRRVARGPLNVVTTCEACQGRGERFTPCHTCGGDGTVGTPDRVRVRIPAGADDGSTVRVAGRGADGAGGERGDLVIETRVRPHRWIRRDGLDLTMTLPVTLAEAYAGAKVKIPTFDGAVELKIPPRSQAGQKLRLRGRGISRGGDKGDLYVELDVRLPDQEDPGLAEALRDAERAYSTPVRAELKL